MVRAILTLCVLLLLNVSFATEIDIFDGETLKFKINDDAGESQLKFESKAPLEDFIGTVETGRVKSSVELSTAEAENTSAKVEFPVKSMTTGIDTRDGHMRGDDWLQADKYPDIKFELNKLQNITIKEENPMRISFEAKAHGNMTIKGTTQKIKAPVSLVLMKESKMTQPRAPGNLLLVKGEFKISLKDFKIQGKNDIIGNKVAEDVNIKMNLYYNTGA